MSEAAIILAIANLIFSGIVIYMNVRQGKILSELRKNEKVFEFNLNTQSQRLIRLRELTSETHILALEILKNKRKNLITNNNDIMAFGKNFNAIASLLTNSTHPSLEQAATPYIKIAGIILDIANNGEPASEIDEAIHEAWDQFTLITILISDQTYQLENQLYLEKKELKPK